MKASVILPAYNAQSTLKEAIDSVLAQSFTDFELIIINDGSIDATDSIISSYQDKRIVYLKNEGNKGLIYTLNRGLEEAKGEYIIRMDADDICMPYRFEHQIQFMDNNPDIAASGTQIEKFGVDGLRQEAIPVSFADLEFYTIKTTPIFHPTAIIRKEFIDKHNIKYNLNYIYAEDYKFWVDIITHGGILANINIVCLKYRVSQSQISTRFSKNQTIISQKIRSEYIHYFIKSKGLNWRDNIDYNNIVSFKELINRYKGKDELNLILMFLYMSLHPYSYRVSKCIISGDLIKVLKYDAKWFFRIILSIFTHKWDYLNIEK